MKFSDVKSFRDIYLKYVEVTNVPDDVRSGLDIEDMEEPLFGLIYVDHEYGITLRIFGNKNTYIDTDALLVRSAGFGDMEFKVIDDKLLDSTGEKIKQVKNYYIDEELEITREDKKIDKFRHSDFPDDVLTVLPTNAEFEQIWVRLEYRADQDNIYFGKVLNESTIIEDYKVGTMVAVEYFKDLDNDREVLVLRGILKENKKED